MKIIGFDDITQAKKKSQSTETCHLALNWTQLRKSG